MPPVPTLASLASLAALAWLTALAAGSAGAPPARAASRCAGAPAVRLSCAPIPERPEWRRRVPDPRTPLVYPRRVEALGGRSREPDGLRSPGGRVTTLAGSRAGERVLLLDLGREVGGHVEVVVRGSTGAPLRLGYAESRRDAQTLGDGPPLREPVRRSDTLPRGFAGTWRSPEIRGGQRYVVLSTAGRGRAVLDAVRVRLTQYRPRAGDYAGRFLSSDPVLNRVWWAGAYTWSLATSPDGPRLVSVDGAKRDRLDWSGDLAIANLTAYATTARARRIARDSLLALACRQERGGYVPMAVEPRVGCRVADLSRPEGLPKPTFGSDGLRLGAYVPLFVSSVARYREHTGDDAFARALLPGLRRALDWVAARAEGGLYRALGGAREINWHPFDRAEGADAFANVGFYAALRDMAALERALGGGEAAAARDESRAAAVRRALLDRLYDPAVGAFRVNTDELVPGYAQDATVFAVASGVLGGGAADRALAFVSRRLASPFGSLTTDRAGNPWMQRYISPFVASWEVLARFARRDDRGALRVVRRLFGHMARTDPGDVLWEKVSPSGGPQAYGTLGDTTVPAPPGQTSLAHGWSTGSTYALSAFVLGIRPDGRDWRVAPRRAGLRWAQGSMLVPAGRVVSRWALGAHGFRLTVRGPSGHAGTLVVPLLGRARAVALDGAIVWDGRRARGGARAAAGADEVVVRGVPGGGTHTLAWAR